MKECYLGKNKELYSKNINGIISFLKKEFNFLKNLQKNIHLKNYFNFENGSFELVNENLYRSDVVEVKFYYNELVNKEIPTHIKNLIKLCKEFKLNIKFEEFHLIYANKDIKNSYFMEMKPKKIEEFSTKKTYINISNRKLVVFNSLRLPTDFKYVISDILNIDYDINFYQDEEKFKNEIDIIKILKY